MNIKLDELLEGILVVPYNEEEIERLEAVCTAIVDGDDFSDDTVADLTLMVLTHTVDSSLKEMFEKSYKTQNETEIKIPRSVCEALAAYTVYKAIGKNEVSYHLSLLNCMIVMNGQWHHQPYPELFSQCVETAIAAVDNKANMGEIDDIVFLQKLFGNQEQLLEEYFDRDSLSVIQKLARDAWYFRTEEYIKEECLKSSSIYERLYVGLTHIVDSMPWIFLNQRVMHQIHDLSPRTNTKELTIAEIIEQVRPHYSAKKELNSNSSILLHLLADTNYRGKKWDFIKTTLSVRHFAVYLYYELLLEKYFD